MQIDNDKSQNEILKIKSHYRSGTSDLGKEFFSPCLSKCNSYKRAAGYFSSSALISWVDALPRFVNNDDVVIQLLISPQLNEEDFNILKMTSNEIIKTQLFNSLSDKIILEAINLVESSSQHISKAARLKIFAWMIVNRHLELRFAFPKHVSASGIFHEKIGIFKFPNGNQIAFTGSANETISGHSNNYESIDVYRSWINEDLERIAIKEGQFKEAWEGHAFGLEILPLTEKALTAIKTYSPSKPPTVSEAEPEWDASIDKTDAKWRHQQEAQDRFLEVGSGVLEMATGTGKTRTAINILTYLFNNKQISGAIITTDGTDLLDQWRKEIDRWNINQKSPLRVLRHFSTHHEMSDFALNSTDAIIIISRGALHKLMLSLPIDKRNKLLIVHDEVHGLGSNENRNNLIGHHKHFGYRLGLSATPEREYDDTGTEFIKNEIGDVIFTFDLKDAIKRGILCEFDYIPLAYEMTEDDKERLHNVYLKKAARARDGRPMTKEEIWTEIAKVYKTAEAKPFVFEQFLKTNNEILKSTIVFVETIEYGSRILPTIHNYTHLYRTYYGDDERSNLVDFSKGKTDCLITCHRISQGIDIVNLNNVVLFSSSRSKLETIQRIGRCLRYNSKNPTKRAVVIDFVRPQESEDKLPNADQDRCEWLTEISKSRKEK